MICATIGYATSQGLGHLTKSFYDAGVIQRVIIYRHPNHPTHLDWYPPGTPVLSDKHLTLAQAKEWLAGVDIMLFFETPLVWDVMAHCKELGIKTALVPMYEWTLKKMPYQFDLIIAPSLLDRDYFPGSTFIPIPVRPDLWRLRTTARRFLHNAGHIGHREHKGTRELLQALEFLKSDLQLTIRAQDGTALRRLLAQVPGATQDPRLTIETGDRPYDGLWDDHDVLVVPEKFNGLSLPLQEGRAAGLVVMTSDRYPHNTWLPQEYLIPVSGYQRAHVHPSYLDFDEALIEPRAIAAKMDWLYGQDISAYSETGQTWALLHSWSALQSTYLEALEQCLSS